MRRFLNKRGLVRLAVVVLVLEVGSWLLLPAIPAAWFPGAPLPEAGLYQAYAPWSYLGAAAFAAILAALLWRLVRNR